MEIKPIYTAVEHEIVKVTAANRGSADDQKRRNRRDRRAPGRPTDQAAGYEDFSADELVGDENEDGVVSLLI